MRPPQMPEATARTRIFQWAVQRREPATITLRRGDEWVSARSHFLWFDEAEGTLALLYPAAPPGGAQPEVAVGEQVGVSFRRGHKKCIFTAGVVARRCGDDGAPMLMVTAPPALHEYQRRAYQRAIVPPERRIAARVLSATDRAILGIGRVSDVSAGGTMIEMEPSDETRWRIGARVRLELTIDPRTPPLCVEGICRHLATRPSGRIGYGVQFVGLEATSQGQAALRTIALLVSELRKAARADDRVAH